MRLNPSVPRQQGLQSTALQDDTLFVLSPTHSTPLASHQQTVQTNHVAFCWSGEKVFAPTRDGQIRFLTYPGFKPMLYESYATNEPSTVEFVVKGHTSACITAQMSPTGRSSP